MARSLIRASAWRGTASALAVAVTIILANDAAAVVLSQWTFEPVAPLTEPFVDASFVDKTAGPVIAATTGTGNATGLHASSATDWTSPVGNGSANSFSANTWGVGDYFQFSSSTTGYENIVISWSQTSSSTGPKDFSVAYATSLAGPFTSASTYSVLPNQVAAPGAGSWSGTIPNAAYSYTLDLSAITALENVSSIFFRLVMATTADATPPGTVAVGGTSRVDNFTIEGDLIPPPSGVPLPSSLLVFGGCAGIAGVARRRLQSIFA